MSSGKAFQLREIKARQVSLGDAEMLGPTVDSGVTRSGAVVLEIDLDRIKPDFSQPRRILPSDLHERLRDGQISPRKAMEQLLRRREGDDVVQMILEGGGASSGLLALAGSVGEVGLRQPINVYEIPDSSHPTSVTYRIAEGERRYWAHWILVLDGREEFQRIRCLVERGAFDTLQVRIRQLAENAVRQDLPAMARARLMLGLKTCLARGFQIEVSPDASLEELGDAVTKARYRGLATRVAELPNGDEVADVPDSHELDLMVGQTLRQYTGKAVSGQMVRNYLALLRLPRPVQELADAANLAEFRLRPLVGLDDPARQLRMVRRIVDKDLSGRQVDALLRGAEYRAGEGKKTVTQARVKGPTPLGLRRRLRSMVTYFEQRMAEVGGISRFSAELRGVEEYREAVGEIVNLRDLLNRILEGMEIKDPDQRAK
jgi:ParB-like chromosome segregation protein Spo0J